MAIFTDTEYRYLVDLALGRLQRGFSREVLRIHPRRIIAWNLDKPGYNARNIECEHAPC